MRMPRPHRAVLILFCLMLFSGLSWAQNALVVHDGTAGLEANVVTNLSGKLTTAGYTVTANVGVPGGALTGYAQIWDVRFNTTTPLSAGDITAYVAYLAGGGSLFVMGENTGFLVRDNSMVALVAAAGGGTLAISTPANAQTVQPPFTGPNAVTAITFLASAGTNSPGSGSLITRDTNGLGAAIVYPPNRMANAPAGTLILVFDVNFLDPTADAPSQAFTNNLIAYLAAPTPLPTSVPTLSEWAMILLACGLVFVAWLTLRQREQAEG